MEIDNKINEADLRTWQQICTYMVNQSQPNMQPIHWRKKSSLQQTVVEVLDIYIYQDKPKKKKISSIYHTLDKLIKNPLKMDFTPTCKI